MGSIHGNQSGLVGTINMTIIVPMRSDNSQGLLLLQLEEALAKWRDAQLPARPRDGWIRTLRGGLRMTATALARRLKISESSVRKIETSEANDAISLGTLRRVAEALNCDLQYALVPRKPLDQVLLDQARRVVATELRPVAHSMSLEDQAVDASARQRQVDVLARALLAHGPSRHLW